MSTTGEKFMDKDEMPKDLAHCEKCDEHEYRHARESMFIDDLKERVKTYEEDNAALRSYCATLEQRLGIQPKERDDESA